MNLISKMSMRVVAMFLPKVEAGACIPPERCYCRFKWATDDFHWVYSNCVGTCNQYREKC